MKHQLAKLRRSNRALIAGTVAMALFMMAPAALSQQVVPKQGLARTGVVFQVSTPEVTIAATDNSASEPGANTGTFTISRTGATTNPLTVNYTISGAAGNGRDYTTLGSTVVIPATQTSVALAVTPVDDTTHEGDERVTVTVTKRDAYTVGSPAAATVTISDNDLPALSVTASDAAASETGSGPGKFTVSRTGPTTGALTVTYMLTGTAINGTDYTALASSVVIPAGQGSASVTVTPANDGVAESAETVILTVTDNALYTVASPAAATVTISDGDLPAVKVVATDDSATEVGPATGTFTVSRTGNLIAAMTVNYTVGGSATNGVDYAALSGSVVIAAGANSATVVVTPVDDSIDETNETVVLTLAAGSGYQIGSSNDDTVTIVDNDGATPNPTPNPPPNPSPDTDDKPKVKDQDQCQNNGWRTFGHFKNQGDCVSWFATDGKNKPAR